MIPENCGAVVIGLVVRVVVDCVVCRCVLKVTVGICTSRCLIGATETLWLLTVSRLLVLSGVSLDSLAVKLCVKLASNLVLKDVKLTWFRYSRCLTSVCWCTLLVLSVTLWIIGSWFLLSVVQHLRRAPVPRVQVLLIVLTVERFTLMTLMLLRVAQFRKPCCSALLVSVCVSLLLGCVKRLTLTQMQLVLMR